MFAKALGAEALYTFSPTTSRWQACLKMGVDRLIHMDEEELAEPHRIKMKLDLIIIATRNVPRDTLLRIIFR